MSCYEWEHGQITLPTAAVAPIKKALREHANTYHERVYAEVGEMHRTVGRGTRSVKVYRQRVHDWQSAHWREQGGRVPESAVLRMREQVRRAAVTVITAMLTNASIHRPTRADVDRIAPRASSRTTTFPVVDQYGFALATVSFDGRVLTWDVPENNRAVDHARDTPLAGLLFSMLDKVRWTRGSGGLLVGNNEYNREDSGVGGGGNYVTATYGPLGTRAAGWRA